MSSLTYSPQGFLVLLPLNLYHVTVVERYTRPNAACLSDSSCSEFNNQLFSQHFTPITSNNAVQDNWLPETTGPLRQLDTDFGRLVVQGLQEANRLRGWKGPHLTMYVAFLSKCRKIIKHNITIQYYNYVKFSSIEFFETIKSNTVL